MMKKTYVIPVCETVEIGNTTIMAGSNGKNGVTGKTSDGSTIEDGGDTDSESNKGTIFNPW